MKILVVHPVMEYLGGGERLCCETIRSLLLQGHQVTLLSEAFDVGKIESFFGYPGLFDRVNLRLYPRMHKRAVLGSTSHLIYHLRAQRTELKKMQSRWAEDFSIVFSTQEPGYIPDSRPPVIQWGYFPRIFPDSRSMPLRNMLTLPVHLHYNRNLSRIKLVLAISEYSKYYLDRYWQRPSVVAYPACKMVGAKKKRDVVVTVARATPMKRLDLFWRIAEQRPQYEFVMLLTSDPLFLQYSDKLIREAPSNGKAVFDPPVEVYHKVLSEAKVYLHFMRGEHFGITIVESMSASCVPIVHDSGGPREIVTDGVGLRWQRIEDVPRMVDEAMKKSPCDAARSRAHEFSIERFDSRLASVLSVLSS